MPDITETAYQQAQKVLKACIDPLGIKASALESGYPQVWARDSMVTLLGAILLDDPTILSALKNSLKTLAGGQAASGCIPSNVVVDTKKTDFRAYMDGNAWFIIGHHLHYTATKDEKFLKSSWPKIQKTCDWLIAQDVFQSGLLAQQEATDWMDHIAVRGRGLYTNALSSKALHLAGGLGKTCGSTSAATYREKSREIKEAIRTYMWMGLDTEIKIDSCDFLHEEYQILAGHMHALVRERPHFLPYIGFREVGVWFDTYGNLLTILFDIADSKQTAEILDYIDQAGVNAPYPIQAIYPVIYPGDRDWRDYYLNRNLNLPHHYHNGGIWPYVGGFYVAALIKAGRIEQARQQLHKLAEANQAGKHQEWEFNEWLHGKTGKAMGREMQAWSAGMYIYAYQCLKQQKVLHFS